MSTTPGVLAPGQEETFFDGHPAAVRSVGALLAVILTAGIAWVVLWIQARGILYRITSQRIVIEKGLLSKRMDQIDLYRIVDYVVERPFGQRLLGTGNIVIEAMDKTTPELRIDGIRANVVGLYERLRTATEKEKLRRNVRVLDIEPA
jgi:uncharacterized membrane protein YdbT with pleckstrin-like domain